MWFPANDRLDVILARNSVYTGSSMHLITQAMRPVDLLSRGSLACFRPLVFHVIKYSRHKHTPGYIYIHTMYVSIVATDSRASRMEIEISRGRPDFCLHFVLIANVRMVIIGRLQASMFLVSSVTLTY